MNKRYGKIYRFLDLLSDIVMIPVLLLALLCSFIMLNARHNNNVPSLFGYSSVTVLSESMKASGFERGDTVIIQKTKDKAALREGDVIAFYQYVDPDDPAEPQTFELYGGDARPSRPVFYESVAAASGSPVWFHMIAEIRIRADGTLWFKTKGTSNAAPDAFWIREDFVIGKYVRTSPALTDFLEFCGSGMGIASLVIVPSGLLLLMLIVQFIEQTDILTMERKIKRRKMLVTDEPAVKKQVGRGMREKDKKIVYTFAGDGEREVYYSLLWGEV